MYTCWAQQHHIMWQKNGRNKLFWKMNNVNTKYITNNMTITLKNINTICYSVYSAGGRAVGRRGLLHRRPEKSLRKSIIAFSFSITETFNVRTWFSPTIPLVTCCCYEFLFISSHSFDEKATEKLKSLRKAQNQFSFFHNQIFLRIGIHFHDYYYYYYLYYLLLFNECMNVS